jgi:anti-sigma factor RsiW
MSRDVNHEEMACQELVEVVTDYLEGALSERERMRFERHLQGCDGCRSYLEQMRTTIRLTGRLTPRSLSPAMRDRLLRAFRDWKSDPDR